MPYREFCSPNEMISLIISIFIMRSQANSELIWMMILIKNKFLALTQRLIYDF